MLFKNNTIRTILKYIPEIDQGINYYGEHVVKLSRDNTITYATLERLNRDELGSLAEQLQSRSNAA